MTSLHFDQRILTRRVFLGSTVVGAGALATFPTVGAAQGGRDAVLAEIERQLDHSARALQKSPSAGAAFQFAGALKTYAAWAEGKNLDAQLRRAIRAGGDRLAEQIATMDLAAELRTRGLALPPTYVPPTVTQIEQALSALRTSGVSKFFRQAAANIEKDAHKLSNIRTVDCSRGFDLLMTSSSMAMCWLLGPEACVIMAIAVMGYDWYMYVMYGC